MNLSHPTHATAAVVFILALSLLVSACMSVRLVSDYDEPTDRALTALQKDTDHFIIELIANARTEKNAFEKHAAFYTDLDKQLRSLEFRANSIPNNKKTVELIAKIRASILGEGKCTEEGNSLRDLHCLASNSSKGPPKVALTISQRNVNQTIGAALALELAKKHGL